MHDIQRNLRVDGARLLARLDALAAIGDTGDGGCRRLALTAEDQAGRDQLCAWIREIGLDLHVDAIGNIVGVLAGETDGPAVIMGSHIDTVATGGRYDGAYGVLAGLEVLQRLKEAGIRPKRPMAVVAFTNEEGARFQPDMLGSCVWAGVLSLEEARAARDAQGVALGPALDAIGYAGPMAPGTIPAHAYLELHIEQGPILDAEGIAIGAVTGVRAITWLEFTFTGEPNHAGTTPMAYRRDAFHVAARLAVFARELTRRHDGLVANVGAVVIEPGNVNVVPKRVVMTLDLRHPDDAVLAEAEAWARGFAEKVAEVERVGVSVRDLARFPAQPFDAGLVDLVEETARRQGHAVRRLHSGAGHDAQMMARLCPTAMIFVPSRDGKSHAPDEFTPPEALIAGADVLLAVAMEVAEA